MADQPERSTQKTPKGLEIPVPKRREVMDAFKRVIGGEPLRCHVCGDPIAGRPYVKATVKVDGERAPVVIHEDCR